MGAVVLVALVAAIPRVIEALRTPLVFDEIYALVLARSGVSSLMATLGHDVDQPLHYLIVWGWRLMVGEGQWSMKAIPLTFGIATVVLTAVLGRKLFGAAAGLAAALLLALHPTHIFFSQQAGFHAMVWFFLLLAFASAWAWVDRPRIWAAVSFVLAGAASIYTDHFSFIVLGAIAIWGLAALRREPRRMLWWIGLVALIVLLYVPQLPTLVVQWKRDVEGERHLAPLGAGDVIELLRKLAWNATYMVVPLVVLAVIPLFRRETRPRAVGLWFVCLAGVLVPWMLSVRGIHLYIVKQWFFTIPFVCLLVAGGLTTLRWRGVGAFILGLLVIFGARAWLLRAPAPEAVDLPRAVEFLRRHAAQGDPVYCTETRALLFLDYHLPEHAQPKLLIMPQSEPFHYSDGILVVPESRQISFDDWKAAIARRPRWWGVRLKHAGRDGAEAASALSSAARGGQIEMDRTTLWIGADTTAKTPR